MVHFNTLSLALFTSLYLSISWNLYLPHFSESYLNLFKKYLKSVHINYNHSTLVVCFCDAWRWQNRFFILWTGQSLNKPFSCQKPRSSKMSTTVNTYTDALVEMWLKSFGEEHVLIQEPWKWKSKSWLSITITMSA